jgi:hypothetical protein
VKSQEENEPKETVMPGKEEAKSPFVMKKYEKTQRAQRRGICDCEGTMHPGHEEQSGEPVMGHNSIEANDDFISKTVGQ